jgi:hypothetical protein
VHQADWGDVRLNIVIACENVRSGIRGGSKTGRGEVIVMLIGELISRFDDEAAAANAVCDLDDSALVARVSKAAEEVELTRGEFVSSSMRYFITHASETDWVAVFGKLSASQNPGQTFLHHVLSDAVGRRYWRMDDSENPAVEAVSS